MQPKLALNFRLSLLNTVITNLQSTRPALASFLGCPIDVPVPACPRMTSDPLLRHHLLSCSFPAQPRAGQRPAALLSPKAALLCQGSVTVSQMKLPLRTTVTVTTTEREAQRMIFWKEMGREVSQRAGPWIRASGAPCARDRQAELTRDEWGGESC